MRPQQIVGATDAIISGRAQLVYPYDGKFYDVPEKYFDIINDTKDLTNVNLEECILFNPHSIKINMGVMIKRSISSSMCKVP